MRFWVSGSAAVLAACVLVGAQTAKAPKKAAGHRANELTLAGLRPGRDSVERAVKLYREFADGQNPQSDEFAWFDPCRDVSLIVDSDSAKRIQVIRLAPRGGSTAGCGGAPPGPWKTGLGLRVTDSTAKISRLYGEPDSKSPSSRDKQQLELWYYAFDWAGPDVPQVMEVLCTSEQDGKPGRVVEITLAAPSL
jgi:hypothetical protein